jgi:hypothetical protein
MGYSAAGRVTWYWTSSAMVCSMVVPGAGADARDGGLTEARELGPGEQRPERPDEVLGRERVAGPVGARVEVVDDDD